MRKYDPFFYDLKATIEKNDHDYENENEVLKQFSTILS